MATLTNGVPSSALVFMGADKDGLFEKGKWALSTKLVAGFLIICLITAFICGILVIIFKNYTKEQDKEKRLKKQKNFKQSLIVMLICIVLIFVVSGAFFRIWLYWNIYTRETPDSPFTVNIKRQNLLAFFGGKMPPKPV